MRILQARILEWVAMPSSRRSSQPRVWTQVSHIAGGYHLSHQGIVWPISQFVGIVLSITSIPNVAWLYFWERLRAYSLQCGKNWTEYLRWKLTINEECECLILSESEWLATHQRSVSENCPVYYFFFADHWKKTATNRKKRTCHKTV